jgi:hypothetical protein
MRGEVLKWMFLQVCTRRWVHLTCAHLSEQRNNGTPHKPKTHRQDRYLVLSVPSLVTFSLFSSFLLSPTMPPREKTLMRTFARCVPFFGSTAARIPNPDYGKARSDIAKTDVDLVDLRTKIACPPDSNYCNQFVKLLQLVTRVPSSRAVLD